MSLLTLIRLWVYCLDLLTNFLKKYLSTQSGLILKFKSNRTTEQLYAFIMYEQYLILIKSPLNALILLIKGEIVGREWMRVVTWTDHSVLFLKKETGRWLCMLPVLMIYFCANLTMPTFRKSHRIPRSIMNMQAEV